MDQNRDAMSSHLLDHRAHAPEMDRSGRITQVKLVERIFDSQRTCEGF